jgi:hypothetical protein
MAVGGGWMFLRSRRQPGLFADIEADLERGPEAMGDEEIVVPELTPQPAMA